MQPHLASGIGDLARNFVSIRWLAMVLSALLGVAVGSTAAAATDAGLVDEILHLADQGQCIESVTYRLIHERGPGHAGGIVQAAVLALSQREQRQRSLGCKGDIATQAIAAGADPDAVLKATAAGL